MVSAVIFVATSCVSPLTGFAFWETNLAYEGESIYNYLQVKNLSDRTILSTNVLFGVQSVTMKDKGLTGMYYDTALAAPALADNANSALILGMGTGTYARQLKQYYPKMNIASVFGNGNMLTADVPNTTNRELFAKKPGSGSEENSMQQASKALNLRETTYERTGSEDLEWYMEEVASRFRKVNEPDSASTILTDDKAPVEVLGMHAIDQIIADEAGPYRQILKDEGFGGLLRAVQ